MDNQLAKDLRKWIIKQVARKKYLSLKLGRSDNDETLNKLLKLLLKTLQKIYI